jgi:predicted nucleic acid-binding protein
MGSDEVMTQGQAWQAYDRWLTDGRVIFLDEPPNLDPAFRALSRHHRPSPKTWADSYLAAFAITSGLRFVTFDRAFEGKITSLLVLKP